MRTPALKLIAALALAFSASSLLAQDWAKSALEKSPRHREYVPLKHGDRTVQAFVVYPEVSHKAPVVVMIFEIFGLSDWAKLMADEIAAQGFIVVAPDLLTGFGPNGGGSEAFPSQDATTRAVSGLDAGIITADLDAAADYGKKLPSANGRLFVTGFCWGGGKSFAFATHRHDLSAAFVFYGTPPSNDVKSITAPVYGFYAGNDARITATVPATTDAMKSLGKKYEPVTYDGAGHGFMRAGQAPDATPANKTAYEEGFKRLIDLINKNNTATSTLHYVPVGSHKPALANVAATRQKPAASASASTPMICHDPTSASAPTANSTKQSTAKPKPAAMDMSSM
jgi:carboxymethylenebutenolidase